ncbi:hypothetical protein [Streptomyces sp. UG1]|uniref:hypothetical protein n=1 Tax=Streptomyces sp. UG1 TaxID=3417652 RepID=UPI003CE7705E
MVQHASEARKEPSGDDLTDPAGADVQRADSPVREPALVGAATHTAEAGQHIRLGNSLDDAGRVGDDIPTNQAGRDLPGDHAGAHLPGGSAENVPGGADAHEHGVGPSASHETPLSHHGDGQGSGGYGDPLQEVRHEGPGAVPHDGPGGGSGHVPTGGPGDGVTGGGHGGSGHNHEPQRVDFSEGDERASVPTGRMQPNQEAAVAEQLARAKMAPQDIEVPRGTSEERVRRRNRQVSL